MAIWNEKERNWNGILRGKILLLHMKLSYSKCKLFSRLDAINDMVTKVWKSSNSLRSQSILVLKFHRMLYFHLVWCSRRKFVLPHIFCRKYYQKKHYQKTSPSVWKNPQIFDKFWPCCYCWCFLFQKQPLADVLQNRFS